jgi:hypothetical protein
MTPAINVNKVLVGIPEGSDHLKDLEVDGRNRLEMDLKELQYEFVN